MLAFLVLGFSMFDTLSGFMVVWLHSTPIRPCLDVTIWEASPRAGCFVHTSPLFRSLWWYACHACSCHLLALFAYLHACLYVHAWVLLASVSSMFQHNKAMDIWSKPIFVPRGHYLLFAFLLLCLFACLLTFWLLCLPCLSCLSALCLFICSLHLFLPLLVCWFLVFAFACMHMERGCLELGHSLLGVSKKGCRHEHVDIRQVALFSRFRSLAFPFGYVLF